MKDNKSKKEMMQEISRLTSEVGNLEAAVDKLRRTEKLLTEEARNYRVVADNTYDWEFWLGPDAQFIYSSPSSERITGYRAAEFEDDFTLFYKLIHPDDITHVAENMNRRKFEAGLSEIEFRIICKDGSIKWIALAFMPVFDGTTFLGTRGSNRDITERKQAETSREEMIVELQQALHNVKQLSGLIPICASCKKIRDDKGYWNQIEAYIKDHSDADFSHGICPDCMQQLYPDLYKKMQARKG